MLNQLGVSLCEMALVLLLLLELLFNYWLAILSHLEWFHILLMAVIWLGRGWLMGYRLFVLFFLDALVSVVALLLSSLGCYEWASCPCSINIKVSLWNNHSDWILLLRIGLADHIIISRGWRVLDKLLDFRTWRCRHLVKVRSCLCPVVNTSSWSQFIISCLSLNIIILYKRFKINLNLKIGTCLVLQNLGLLAADLIKRFIRLMLGLGSWIRGFNLTLCKIILGINSDKGVVAIIGY
jgi:hypothetical protein